MAKSVRRSIVGIAKRENLTGMQTVTPPGVRGSNKPGGDIVHGWTRSSPGIDDVTFSHRS